MVTGSASAAALQSWGGEGVMPMQCVNSRGTNLGVGFPVTLPTTFAVFFLFIQNDSDLSSVF